MLSSDVKCTQHTLTVCGSDAWKPVGPLAPTDAKAFITCRQWIESKQQWGGVWMTVMAGRDRKGKGVWGMTVMAGRDRKGNGGVGG